MQIEDGKRAAYSQQIESSLVTRGKYQLFCLWRPIEKCQPSLGGIYHRHTVIKLQFAANDYWLGVGTL